MTIKDLLHLIALRKDYLAIERLQNTFDLFVGGGNLEAWMRTDIEDIAKDYEVEPMFLAMAMPVILATFDRDFVEGKNENKQ